jgi:RNAse (barnase) inhibitor barstar
MKNYVRLFFLGDPYFHVVEMDSNDFNDLMEYLEHNLPSKAFLTTIDLSNISDDKTLFRIFQDSFDFPWYFGYNWNAFHECMTDLSWIKSGAYILILKNLEKIPLDDEGKQLLFRSLIFITKEWRNGMYYNEEFPNPHTPFHIVFASETANISTLTKLLDSNGIKDIGRFKEIKDPLEK